MPRPVNVPASTRGFIVELRPFTENPEDISDLVCQLLSVMPSYADITLIDALDSVDLCSFQGVFGFALKVEATREPAR